ncbi:hypothetical protein N7541_003356 [Penicillium brevicompactum]|uniref:Uncharacterized protein n=1 Tax=Penicillium brevicompactum TaxID=5074 RepID=A0A9W9RLN7_PENBR|nr:hypothetical protein N7541_003356 [Penicillium brevicompactum]
MTGISENKLRARSTSMSSNPDLQFSSDAESEHGVNHIDHSVVTKRGAPARHSRKERHTWNRTDEPSRRGKTGSKGRSTSRH